MTYVITQPCVDVLDRACIDECPVDCIYEGDRMLYIHPDECVDCGACEPVCPVEAIYYEDDVPDKWKDFYNANVEFFSDLGSPGTMAGDSCWPGKGWLPAGPGTGLPGPGPAAARFAARLSRSFFRFSNRFSVWSMRTVRNFKTTSDTRRRRSNSLTAVGSDVNWNRTYVPSRYLSTR